MNTGQIVAGRYRIDGWLGEGGMARVFRATNFGTGRACALKVLRGDVAVNAKVRELFVREARIGSIIGHNSHIVDVWDAGVDEGTGTTFMVMELLQGDTLDGFLKRAGPAPWPVARLLLEQLGDALEQAHDAGVVHRDLKPSNLFVEQDRKGRISLKVLDFGIAKVFTEEVQRTATQIGTPGYAAPEQVAAAAAWRELAANQGVRIAKDVSPATDVWAVGLVTYDLLSGLPEGHYWGDVSGFEQVLHAILGVRKPASVQAGERGWRFPAGFDQWFATCLHADASQRWQKVSIALEKLFSLFDAQSARERADGPGFTQRAPAPQAPTVDDPAVSPDARPVPRGRADLAPVEPNGARPGKPARGAKIVLAFLTIAGAVALLNMAAHSTDASSQPDAPPAPSSTATSLPGTTAQTTATGTTAQTATPSVPGATAPTAVPTAPSAADETMGSNWRRATEPVPSETANAVPEGRIPAGMIRIAGGVFNMGSDDVDNESPVHRVRVQPFDIDETEVTVSAYKTCVDERACSAPADGNFDEADRASHPINMVTWEQAQSYCEWTNKRLPTEEEWEFAARGSDGRPYVWGKQTPDDQLCWKRNDDQGTCPVDAKPDDESVFGVRGMAGNVMEWTSSSNCPYEEPNCGKRRGVRRGGSWNGKEPYDVRTTTRVDDDDPKAYTDIGFRCAHSLQ